MQQPRRRATPFINPPEQQHATVALTHRTYHEGGLLALQEVDGLDGLGFEPVHNVDHEDGDIAQRRSASTQVGERLVPRCVNDEEARHVDLLAWGEDVQKHFRLLHPQLVITCLRSPTPVTFPPRDAGKLQR